MREGRYECRVKVEEEIKTSFAIKFDINVDISSTEFIYLHGCETICI